MNFREITDGFELILACILLGIIALIIGSFTIIIFIALYYFVLWPITIPTTLLIIILILVL